MAFRKASRYLDSVSLEHGRGHGYAILSRCSGTTCGRHLRGRRHGYRTELEKLRRLDGRGSSHAPSRRSLLRDGIRNPHRDGALPSEAGYSGGGSTRSEHAATAKRGFRTSSISSYAGPHDLLRGARLAADSVEGRRNRPYHCFALQPRERRLRLLHRIHQEPRR